jgi:hypothetical protein
MTLFLVNLGLILVFLYLISRQPGDELMYDEEYFLQNPSALEEYHQMPIEFQKAFFRKHKDWIKEKYMRGDHYILGFCPNKEIRRKWLAEFLQKKEMSSPSPS